MNKCSALLCHTQKELCFSCGNIALLSAFGTRKAFSPTLPMWWFVVLFSGRLFVCLFLDFFGFLVFISVFIRGFVEESSICLHLEISEGWAKKHRWLLGQKQCLF